MAIYATDFRQITDQLNAEALRFCMQFLPNGARKGDFWCSADILDSHRGGDSFVVYLKGNKSGFWVENGEPTVVEGKYGGKQGFLVNIIMAQRKMTYVQAVKFAKDWLGIIDPADARIGLPTAKSFKKTDDEWKISTRHLFQLREDSKVFKYLTEERGITPEILKKYRVKEAAYCFNYRSGDKTEFPAMAFPVYSGRGESAKVLNIKYIGIQRTEKGGKRCAQDPHGTCHLWGWQAIDENAEELVICEGEIDAMTVAMLGYNAVSVPQGAHADSPDGKMNMANAWIDNDWERLSQFQRIKICMDNDDPGKAAALTLYNRLGVHRCEIVEIPKPSKDANEIFFDNPEYLRSAIESARGVDPIQLKRAIDFKQKLRDRLDGKEAYTGRNLPWNLNDWFRIRNGEITVVSGYSGHGKTEWLNDLLLNLCLAGDERACVASLEVPIDRTLESLWEQCSGKKNDYDKDGYKIPNLFENTLDVIDQHFFFYDCVEAARIDDIIEVFSYAARRYGVKLFCLDSVMCVDVDEGDLDSVKKVMQKLAKFVMKYDCHLFLVAHSKKPDEKRPESKHPPSKHSVSGSKAITDLAHNIVIVWRNISKDERLISAKMINDSKKMREIADENDATFYVRKQRNGIGKLPSKQLWFDVGSRQFRDAKDKPIREFTHGDPIMGNLGI